MKNSKVTIVNSLNNLSEKLDHTKILVWSGFDSLHELLDKHNEELAPYANGMLYIVKEIHFSDGAFCKLGKWRFQASSFSELISSILAHQSKLDNVTQLSDIPKVYLKTTDEKLVLETEQQFLNARIVAFVQTVQEKKQDFSVRMLIENKATVLKYLDAIVSSSNSKQASIDEIALKIKSILELIENIKAKRLRLAVVGNKKSGKSALINALLGNEYAFSSFELPTPGTVIYTPNGSLQITVEYRGQKLQFHDIKELKKFLRKKFSEAVKSKEVIREMVVYYPSNSEINYEIWDTPGTDLAGVDYEEALNEALQKVDGVIFVIDYSKYAQESEINLLKKVFREWEARGRKTPVLIVLNKIDEMFSDANSNQNIESAREFIYQKLLTLGFSNFVLIPCSALIHFNFIKTLERIPKLREAENIAEELEKIDDEIHKSKEFQTDGFITHFTSIQNFFKTIKVKHISKKNTSTMNFERLLEYTNIPLVSDYVKHVYVRKLLKDETEKLLRKLNGLSKILLLYTKLTKTQKEQAKLLLGSIDKGSRKDTAIEKAKNSVRYFKQLFDEDKKVLLKSIHMYTNIYFSHIVNNYVVRFYEQLYSDLYYILRNKKEPIIDFNTTLNEVKHLLEKFLDNLREMIMAHINIIKGSALQDKENFEKSIRRITDALAPISPAHSLHIYIVNNLYRIDNLTLKCVAQFEHLKKQIEEISPLSIDMRNYIKRKPAPALLLNVILKILTFGRYDYEIYKCDTQKLENSFNEVLANFKTKLVSLLQTVLSETSSEIEKLYEELKTEYDEKSYLALKYISKLLETINEVQMSLE